VFGYGQEIKDAKNMLILRVRLGMVVRKLVNRSMLGEFAWVFVEQPKKKSKKIGIKMLFLVLLG